MVVDPCCTKFWQCRLFCYLGARKAQRLQSIAFSI